MEKIERKIFLELDEKGYIISTAQEKFDGFIKTDISVEDFMKDFAGVSVTDGYHKFENGAIVKGKGSEKLIAEARKVEEEELRAERERECFSIINRGKLWYDTLTQAEGEELKTWYGKWLDVTKTLVVPSKPAWLK